MSLQVIEWQDFLEPKLRPNPVFSGQTPEGAAITIGVFDGVHLGHRMLINKIVQRGPNPTIVTFRENPKKVILRLAGKEDTYEGDIFSLEQKLTAFENLGAEKVILIDFSEDFSKLKGREFFELLYTYGRMGFLAIGSNFRCGFRQDTNAELIREMNTIKGIPTEIVAPLALPMALPEAGDSEPVSSSRIRSAISCGHIALAAAMMGRNVEVDLRTVLMRTGIRTDSQVYDLRSAARIAPGTGSYPVLIHPGVIAARAVLENGNLFLSGPFTDREKTEAPVERLEFLPV